MKKKAELAQRILDTALDLAEHQPWETLRLYDVAERMEISLEELHSCFGQKEELIDAWFDRADRAMLHDAATTDFTALAPLERIERVMMVWLNALAPHQRVTRQMILGRLEPGHLHIQLAGVMRISRTVQWMREAARRNAAYLNRALEETVLTSIYLVTFAQWLGDDSRSFDKTRRGLRRRLRGSDFLLHLTEGHREHAPIPNPPQEYAESGSTRTHH